MRKKKETNIGCIENFLIRFKGKLVFSSIVIFNGVYREEHRGVNRIYQD